MTILRSIERCIAEGKTPLCEYRLCARLWHFAGSPRTYFIVLWILDIGVDIHPAWTSGADLEPATIDLILKQMPVSAADITRGVLKGTRCRNPVVFYQLF